jgi:hypothetical protein
MRRKSFGLLRPYVLTATLLSGLIGTALSATAPVVSSVSEFQPEEVSTSPGAHGLAVLEKKGSDQIFSVMVSDLTGVSNGSSGSFGVFVSAANNTNSPISLIGPMGLEGSNNTWVLRYEATGAPPAQLGVSNMDELVGQYLIIANPGFTNVVNGVTNEVVEAILFARMPAFTTRAGALHFNRKSPLTVPSVAPPNPHEKGYVRTIFTASQGRSVFDLTAIHLSGGGTYSVFIEDPPSSSMMTNIGLLMISTNGGQNGTFNADTRVGETLPLQVPAVGDLSGRTIQIRDAFDEIHLQGTIP